MEKIENPKYQKLVAVCVRERECEACCAAKGSPQLYDKLKEELKATDPSVRVVKTSCLGHCSTGITVSIQPHNVWLAHVTEEDIPEIVRLASE